MVSWTKEDLNRLDVKYAREGVQLHQRPFRAAVDLLGAAFSLGSHGESEATAIMDAYAELVPEVNTTWPGAGVGLAVSVDRVRKLTLPVVFGQSLIEPWQVTGFNSIEEWWEWCRGDRDIAADAHFAVADLYDFTYGLDGLATSNSEAERLWQMARSNLEDIANVLPSTFSVDSVIQPICMVTELVVKGALVWEGADPKTFKGKDGHDLSLLAKRLGKVKPHRDDPLVELVVSRLPPYVESRYSPAGLTRLEVVRLALAVQFVAAATIRRFTGVDLAAQMESGGWPAPRRPFFS